jgi:hypothetical protein
MNRQYFAWTAGILAVSLMATTLFGFAGFRTIFGIIAFFVVPGAILMRKLDLEPEEKIFFSLFASLGLFPLAVFLVNYAVPSLRISIIVAMAILVAIAIIYPRIGKKQPAQS